MNKRHKRELLARVITVLALVIPAILGIIGGITTHTIYGWEGRAAAVFAIGGIITIANGVVVGTTWAQYENIKRFPLTHGHERSWLREWIEEPEIVKTPPKEGAWKE